MKELESILKHHAKAYPLMEPADAVKLICQNEFGGGHLIRDEQAVAAIDALLGQKSTVTVAIDGRCGAGKTTLASQLQAHYGCTVIPMDHFFLRPEQRATERLATPGENADHERFLEEVLLPLRRGERFSYRPFDCSRMELAAPVAVNPAGLTIIEGSYSCHPALWEHYDLHIFLTVDPEEQMRRLILRNGDYAQVFRQKWIPLEEAYFAAFDLESNCDLLLST